MHKLTRVLYSMFGFVVSILCKNDYAFARLCKLDKTEIGVEDYKGHGEICDYMKNQANLSRGDRDKDDDNACGAFNYMFAAFAEKGPDFNYYVSEEDKDWLKELDDWCNTKLFRGVASLEELTEYDQINDWFVQHGDASSLNQMSYCYVDNGSDGAICYSVGGVNHIKSCPLINKKGLQERYRFFGGANMVAYRMIVDNSVLYGGITDFMTDGDNRIVSCAGSYMTLSELQGDCNKILWVKGSVKPEDLCYYDYEAAGVVSCNADDRCVGSDEYGEYQLIKQSDGKKAGHGYYNAEQYYCANNEDKSECLTVGIGE